MVVVPICRIVAKKQANYLVSLGGTLRGNGEQRLGPTYEAWRQSSTLHVWSVSQPREFNLPVGCSKRLTAGRPLTVSFGARKGGSALCARVK
jgi:hypothetical protein